MILILHIEPIRKCKKVPDISEHVVAKLFEFQTETPPMAKPYMDQNPNKSVLGARALSLCELTKAMEATLSNNAHQSILSRLTHRSSDPKRTAHSHCRCYLIHTRLGAVSIVAEN